MKKADYRSVMLVKCPGLRVAVEREKLRHLLQIKHALSLAVDFYLFL